MRRTLDILAKALGIGLYPLWMPTYGMMLYMLAVCKLSGPIHRLYVAFAIGGTFFFTAFVPLMMILFLIHRGQVHNIHISNPDERTTPYIYSITCYGFWCYFLHSIMHIGPYFLCVAIGATIALGMVTLVNLRWKISAHLTGLGGLIGGVLAYYFQTGQDIYYPLIITLLIVALLLMFARIYLREHTPLQVIAGLLLGILLTFFTPVTYALVQNI